MNPRRRVDQTRFIFPIGTFDRVAAPAPGPSSNQVDTSREPELPPPVPERAPELRTVYDDDQRPPGIDAEDEADPE